MAEKQDKSLKKFYGTIAVSAEVLKQAMEPVLHYYLTDDDETVYYMLHRLNKHETLEMFKARMAERANAARLDRQKLRESTEPVKLTLAALLEKLEWTTKEATHFIQEYCECWPFDDSEYGSELCIHAKDLDITFKSGREL
jgi:hypothetical protein